MTQTGKNPKRKSWPRRLTRKQYAIIDAMLGRGAVHRRIAEVAGCSMGTVRNRVRKLQKVGAPTQSRATAARQSPVKTKKTDESTMRRRVRSSKGKRTTGTAHVSLTVTKDDPVNHPAHYAAGRAHEPIDVIEDWKLGLHLGNAVKYISRCERSGRRLQDLQKARWYLDRYIGIVEREIEKESKVSG